MKKIRIYALAFTLSLSAACAQGQEMKEKLEAPVVTDRHSGFGYTKQESIICEGQYEQHLQGIALDNDGNIYWSFTTELVKTDKNGKIQSTVNVAYHHGDLCVVDGKIYVAVGFGKWNHIDGLADSWVYVYDSESLKEIERHQVPHVVYGAGGIVHKNDKFFVVGGLPSSVDENYIYEYDKNFNFVSQHTLKTGHTDLGIQTIEYHDNQWWLGMYGHTKLFILEDDFSITGRYPTDLSLGVASLKTGEILVGKNEKQPDGTFIGIATRFVKNQD